MNCKTFRSQIETTDDPFAAGRDMIAHAEICHECRLILRDRTALYSMLSELTPIVAPGDFEWRLRARLMAGKNGASGLEGVTDWLWRMPIATPAIALLILIIGGGGYLIKQKDLPSRLGLEHANTIRGDVSPNATAFVREWSKEQAMVSPLSDLPQRSNSETGDSARGASRQRNLLFGTKSGDSHVSLSVRHADRAVSQPVVLEKQYDSVSPKDFSFAGVALDVPDKELKVVVPGEKGQVHKVTLRSVTFGSEQILDRRTTQPAKIPEVQGIW